jgi:hypothetical protein
MLMRTTGKPFSIDKKQVYEAYKAVKSNAGSAGVDGQTIEQFEADLQNNLYKLWNRMSSGSGIAERSAATKQSNFRALPHIGAGSGRECASGRVFRPRDLAGKSFRNDGEAYPFGSYCAGAVAGLAAAAALCGFFFGLSVAGLVSNPGGGLAASGEDDVGVQWTAGLVLPSFAFAFVPFASGAFAPVAFSLVAFSSAPGGFAAKVLPLAFFL